MAIDFDMAIQGCSLTFSLYLSRSSTGAFCCRVIGFPSSLLSIGSDELPLNTAKFLCFLSFTLLIVRLAIIQKIEEEKTEK